MSPHTSRHAETVGVDQRILRVLLRAIATFRQSEQPEMYAHVHPHCHATAKLARAFAADLMHTDTYSDHTLDEIELGAHVHDIGKYLIPKSILLKPGPLTAQERETVSRHPAYGTLILSNLCGMTDTANGIVLYHHERWDGTGYPEGLEGIRIPFAARLVAICDVYTSLRAKRVYKPSLTRRKVALTMGEMAGRELDPRMVEDFFRFARAKQQDSRTSVHRDSSF
ncbi:MAG TPA: HD domain-containing phosphohydrolase [Pyrinomonadaceae bacterium]|nr:HD domain-containing phosphohydrolase [Pyrinomonadaceae bacterium]